MEFRCIGSDSVDVSNTGSKGRYCLATKKLSRGAVVTSNHAYCWVLRSSFTDTHCSNCMKQSSSLKRCTICTAVQYCDKSCQKNDWSQHKHECKHIAGLLSKLTDQDFDDAKLLVRTIMLMNASKSDEDECCVVNGVVHCCMEHIKGLSVPTVGYDESLLGVLSVVCSITKQPMETVAKLLFQFRSNNFGITNELMTCTAAGVFPHAAILNHSCNPNCILRYAFSSSGPILHIVALKDIEAGEELTHSYVDCTQPRVMRQLTLSEHYDFTCDCSLCAASRNRTSSKTLKDEMHQFHRGDSGAEQDPLALRKFLQSYQKSHQQQQTLNCDSLMTEIKVSTDDFVGITSEVEALVSKAQEQDFLNDDVINSPTSAAGEGSALSLLERALSKLQPACGPFNFELYKLRGRLMTQYLLMGEAQKAFEQCRCMVSYLTLSLYHIPYHPLLGLQLFTLGDIARDVGELQYASEAYDWSVSILRVSHGEGSELLQRLELSRVELRSELMSLK